MQQLRMACVQQLVHDNESLAEGRYAVPASEPKLQLAYASTSYEGVVGTFRENLVCNY